jgi:diguanylate cyclase (GGDEF)-like protein/PAS domain S-box-containing protein
MSTNSLLLIEDNPGDARLLREMFADSASNDIVMTQVGCMREAEALLAQRRVDVILLDLGLPDTEGLRAVQRAHAAAPRVPLVVLTGLDDESMAVQALQEGAQDYLVKGQIETRGLLRSLRYAIERKTMEEALFVEKERAQVTLNSIGDAVICTDFWGNVTFLNAVAEHMTGWSGHEAQGRPLSDVFQMLDLAGRETISIPVGGALGNDRTVQTRADCVLVRRDGVEFAIEDSVAPIHDREGQSTGAVLVFRDVSAARAASMRMAHSAQHDFLTGLPNRMLLSDRLSQAIVLARRHTKQTAVLFLDLDGFKHINDSLGHSIGDRLLQSIGTRLLGCARASDTVSRQGGDEFIVLLSEMEHPEDAAIAARRILEAVSQGHSIDQHELHVTASIGVSVYPDDGLDAETLIKSADLAMYQAKENGRQKYQFFEPAMNARAVERQSIEQNLRRALERNELTLHYQPKVDFKTGAITGAEALLRWTHPTEGPISPARFIPVAEDCGLILPIGNWVLRQACAQARAWADAGLPPATMAVNISAKEFRNETFLEGVFAILEETGLDPRSLELELTESVLMKHSESAASILQALRQRGVQVALDDFGTGYSSLSYLRKFPVDALKIDQSFVAQITAGGDASIVKAVISMARSLKLRVIAEGVETLEQLAFLRAHECDEAQGYYFSRPVAPAQFATLLRTGIAVPIDRLTTVSPGRAPSDDRPSLRRRAREQRPVRRPSWRAPVAAAARSPGQYFVTDSARMEQALRESVGRLKQLVESRERLLRDSTVMNDRLVELARFKDEVAAMIVHDLRNPLSVMLLNYDFVLEGFEGPTDCREALEESQGAGRRMLTLLTNLIDVSRLEDGMLHVSVSEVNLSRLLAPLVEQRLVLARTRKISLVLAPSPDITVTVDADLVLRTVENILDNAIRYTPTGGCVEINLREVDSDVEIRVGNSGCAIPAEARHLVFDKHAQAGPEIARMNAGLGLYFCRLATEAQGGRIWVEETERLPTVFGIRLPRQVAVAAARQSIGPVAVPS